MADARERLKSLEGLLDDGLISGAEYAEKRKRILDELLATDRHEPTAAEPMPIARTEPMEMSSSGWGSSWTGRQLWISIGVFLGMAIIVTFAASGGTDSGPRSSSTSGPYSGLVAEYGGARSVYAEIAAETSCAELQATFDRAGDNFDRTGDRWSIGYMTAADERMREVGCY